MNKIAKANMILLVQYALGSLIPLLLIPHIVSVIGLLEYGRIAVVMAWGGYGAMVVQYAFQMTGPAKIMQVSSIYEKQEIFTNITKAKIEIFIAVLIACIGAAYVFNMFDTLFIILIGVPFAACINSVWFLQTQDKFLSVCLLSIMASLLTLIIGKVCIGNQHDYALEITSIVLIFPLLLTAIGSMLISIAAFPKISLDLNFTGAHKELLAGASLFVSQFISMLYTSSGTILINAVVSAESAGEYSVLERIINAFIAAAMLTHVAAYPKLASAYTENKKNYFKILTTVISIYVIMTAVISSVVWIFRADFISYMYASNRNIEILLLSALLWFILSIFGTALTGYLTVSGKTAHVIKINLITLVASYLLGLPAMLIMGSAGWLLSLSIAQIGIIWSGYKYWTVEREK